MQKLKYEWARTPIYSRMLFLCVVFLMMLLIVRHFLGVPYENPLFTVIGLIGGWIMALLTARWNSQQDRVDESRMNAYRTLQDSVAICVKQFINLRNRIAMWSDVVTLSVQANVMSRVSQKGTFKWNIMKTPGEEEWTAAQEAYDKFIATYDSTRILFRDIDGLYQALLLENFRMRAAWKKYHEGIVLYMLDNPEGPQDNQATHAIISDSETMKTKLMAHVEYFGDFSTVLQNSVMGPFLGIRLPMRAAESPFKNLQDVLKECSDKEKVVSQAKE